MFPSYFAAVSKESEELLFVGTEGLGSRMASQTFDSMRLDVGKWKEVQVVCADGEKRKVFLNRDESKLEEKRRQCTKNLECGACIKHPHCAWCADPKWEYQGYKHQSNVDQNTISCSNTKAIIRRRPRCDLKDRYVNSNQYEVKGE